MATLVYPQAGSLSGPLKRFAGVPFLLSREMAYLDEPSEYLRQRALGRWHPNHPAPSEYWRGKKLSDRTVEAYGNDLQNFFSFLEATDSDWRTVGPQDLLEEYEEAMLNGQWSRAAANAYRPPGLKPSTVNRRSAIATEFFLWASLKGFCGRVPPTTSSKGPRPRSSIPIRVTDVDAVHARRNRVDPKCLRLPTGEELEEWLKELKARHGKTVFIAARCILETGVRVEELALLRASDLPQPDDIPPDRPAKMLIKYGTKGGRTPGDPAKIGKSRELRFDRDFLVRLHDYKRLRRPVALDARRRRGIVAPPPPQLFLSERTGEPLSISSFRKAWVGCSKLPFVGFTPHAGRHTFACETLLSLLRDEAKAQGIAARHLPASFIQHRGDELIRMYIRPAMGHLDEHTTDGYLSWVAEHLSVSEARLAYSRRLDELDE